jgi:hypothetical protein
MILSSRAQSPLSDIPTPPPDPPQPNPPNPPNLSQSLPTVRSSLSVSTEPSEVEREEPSWLERAPNGKEGERAMEVREEGAVATSSYNGIEVE